jgi:hypothetical protein
MKTPLCVLLLVLLTSGCSTMLPQAHTDSSSFENYEEARTFVAALVPMKSNRKTLERGAVNPSLEPNTKFLTHAEVVRLLVPTTLLRREDLDPGILVCMESRDACYGMELVASKIAKVRTGSFLADFSNFRRRTETSGWRFSALILFVNDVVVYRSWGGQPLVNEVEVNSNPLGPFQDVGPSLLSSH